MDFHKPLLKQVALLRQFYRACNDLTDHVSSLRLVTTGLVNFPYSGLNKGNNNYHVKEKK